MVRLLRRGPQGIWTLRKKKMPLSTLRTPFEYSRPSFTHMVRVPATAATPDFMPGAWPDSKARQSMTLGTHRESRQAPPCKVLGILPVMMFLSIKMAAWHASLILRAYC